MNADRPCCQFVTTKPTVENVTPFAQFQLTQPRLKGVSLQQLSALPILYGGGRNFLFGRFTDSEPQLQDTDLFVLDSCILLWPAHALRGLRIPYDAVIYHAVRRADVLELVLAVERDATLDSLFPPAPGPQPFALSTLELRLRPRYATYDRHYSGAVEQLFTFRDFGLNRGDAMVANCNTAIATCMEFHHRAAAADDDDDDDDGPAAHVTPLAELLAPAGHVPIYANHGSADDLTDDGLTDDGPQGGAAAGMALAFCSAARVPTKRRRQD
ncbi:AER086Cp [Eremothecium gossypii ATCC 10895]|uniref:Protein LOT5 n=1 Tax=Eremothecium gossypii (strain ATCC 10895 / CBS 109.51 / FGSC 9923 / NRRL Y-1056) TaxID=284811 RepID=LOT5_EREGS|nr:AER086Cp [Eremothecium gossypii ATCC 10895]Q757C7.2 RecName: Full=Protein LOT5 [Eremothecium gossypii ATCC 10895]AAS52770.2 AER086Cp [Eremothecium gossypii ATCC 10895]AEY97076.1 FAER086Cp [Eremothecium gossypii FDAG1]